MQSQFPKVNLIGSMSDSKLNSNIPSMRLDSVNSDNKISSFEQTMIDMTRSLNDTVNAPDQVMQDMLTGNNETDIHDVITAINKAEMSVTVATQITSKIVQAYEKITQIQV